MRAFATVLALSLMACSSQSVPDDGSGGVDASDSSAMDTSVQESGVDASDSTIDAIVDSGPDVADTSVCECLAGACCDGCHFRPASHVCATSRTDGTCLGSSTFCGGKARTLTYGELATHCTGNTTACNGTQTDTTITVDCYEPTPGNFEQFGVCMPANVGSGLLARCALNCGV